MLINIDGQALGGELVREGIPDYNPNKQTFSRLPVISHFYLVWLVCNYSIFQSCIEIFSNFNLCQIWKNSISSNGKNCHNIDNKVKIVRI